MERTHTPIIRFIVRVLPDPSWTLFGLSNGQHRALENVRSTLIPGLSTGDNFVGKNDNSIILYGHRAIYYKKLIDEGQIKDLIYEIVHLEPPTPVVAPYTGAINTFPINAAQMNGIITLEQA